MNLTPRSIPGLKSLYWSDLAIRRAANVAGFGVLVFVGMSWASQPVSSASPAPSASFESEMGPMIALGGLVLSALATLVGAWRYLRVRKILSEGITIRATVEDLEVHTWRSNRRRTPTSKPVSRHSHWATLRYAVHGVEQRVCLRLPNSGSTFGLKKGAETDVIVLDTAPSQPLIRAVYLGQS